MQRLASDTTSLLRPRKVRCSWWLAPANLSNEPLPPRRRHARVGRASTNPRATRLRMASGRDLFDVFFGASPSDAGPPSLIGWLAGWLVRWLAGWLAGELAVRSEGWLADRLDGWLTLWAPEHAIGARQGSGYAAGARQLNEQATGARLANEHTTGARQVNPEIWNLFFWQSRTNFFVFEIFKRF